MHAVVQTDTFISSAADCGLTDDELVAIVSAIAADPLCGDLIAGTGGARKVRFAGRGKGKSGGYRTIHYVAAVDVPVFLLDVYSKGDKANLTKSERNTLAKLLGILESEYRADVRANAQRSKWKME